MHMDFVHTQGLVLKRARDPPTPSLWSTLTPKKECPMGFFLKICPSLKRLSTILFFCSLYKTPTICSLCTKILREGSEIFGVESRPERRLHVSSCASKLNTSRKVGTRWNTTDHHAVWTTYFQQPLVHVSVHHLSRESDHLHIEKGGVFPQRHPRSSCKPPRHNRPTNLMHCSTICWQGELWWSGPLQRAPA